VVETAAGLSDPEVLVAGVPGQHPGPQTGLQGPQNGFQQGQINCLINNVYGLHVFLADPAVIKYLTQVDLAQLYIATKPGLILYFLVIKWTKRCF
jgi:hypothetical protein